MYGGAYTWTIFGVSNKQASHKQENEHVLITRLCHIKTKTKRQCIAYCRRFTVCKMLLCS